jgi:hypothetical protein
MRYMDRDREIVEFIKEFKCVNAELTRDIFFPGCSLRVAQNRLKILHDNKLIKKFRRTQVDPYVYYYKVKPQQVEHNFLLVKFIAELKKLGSEILKAKKHMTIDNVIADGFIAFSMNGNNYIALIECENTKKFNYQKYFDLYNSGAWTEFFPSFPLIIVVTNKEVEESSLFKVIRLNSNFDNLENLIINLL